MILSCDTSFPANARLRRLDDEHPVEDTEQRAQIRLFDQSQQHQHNEPQHHVLVSINWDNFLQWIIVEVCARNDEGVEETQTYAIEHNTNQFTYMDVLVLLGFPNMDAARMEITWTDEASALVENIPLHHVAQPLLFQADYHF